MEDKYHESLFDKGFKDVHIVLTSPIIQWNLEPLLKHLIEVQWNEKLTKAWKLL
jgi:hypothetical protein